MSAREIRRILEYAIKDDNRALEPLDVGIIEQQKRAVSSPRWPTAIHEIELKTRGFYGFTALAGKKKLGKTIAAMASSLEAARSGRWEVYYAYGENTADRMRELMRNRLGPEDSEELPAWLENWSGLRFFPGHRIESLVTAVTKQIRDDTQRVLIVIDSVNRLARTARMDYLRALGRICQVAQTASEESRGHIGFLALSELNQRGGMSGLDIEHAAACLVWMRRTKDPRKVKFEIDSRETVGGVIGELIRDYEHCRFVSQDELDRAEKMQQGDLLMFPYPKSDTWEEAPLEEETPLASYGEEEMF